MTTLAEFATNFSGREVPPALANLLAFQEQNGFESYSEWAGCAPGRQTRPSCRS